MRKQMHVIWTTGYEKLNWEDFVKLLKEKGIECVVDVRQNAFSMRPEYTRHRMKKALASESIEYIHMPEFGNPYRNQEWEELFRERIERLEDRAFYELANLCKKRKVVLLCYEREPQRCHRTILAQELVKRGLVEKWMDIRVPACLQNS